MIAWQRTINDGDLTICYTKRLDSTQVSSLFLYIYICSKYIFSYLCAMTHNYPFMTRYVFLIITICSWVFTDVNAQDFSKYFSDNTLRIDYIFSGNASEQHIAVDEMSVSPRWYGKRMRLAEVPMEGNGQITVRSTTTGEVIFRNSFSTLFQEWLTYDDAKVNTRALQNVFLIPMPKDSAYVTVTLFDNRRQEKVSLTHTVHSNDILIRHTDRGDTTPYDIIFQPADTSRCINIAFVAEGYTDTEMPTYLEDVKTATDAIFAHEPFASMKDRFRIIAVKSASEQSGTSVPSEGDWRRTVLSSHFDTFYMDRYLTTLHLKDLHDVLTGIPYEHIIVLVNTDRYGGGGILNSYNLSMTHHRSFRSVVVHEFGHSFAGLADEYAYEEEAIPMYPHDIEPWEENITTKVDMHSKWQDLIDEGKAGLYEGAGYSLKGIWRPSKDCRMRTNECPEFCTVCRRVISRIIDFYTR